MSSINVLAHINKLIALNRKYWFIFICENRSCCISRKISQNIWYWKLLKIPANQPLEQCRRLKFQVQSIFYPICFKQRVNRSQRFHGELVKISETIFIKHFNVWLFLKAQNFIAIAWSALYSWNRKNIGTQPRMYLDARNWNFLLFKFWGKKQHCAKCRVFYGFKNIERSIQWRNSTKFELHFPYTLLERNHKTVFIPIQQLYLFQFVKNCYNLFCQIEFWAIINKQIIAPVKFEANNIGWLKLKQESSSFLRSLSTKSCGLITFNRLQECIYRIVMIYSQLNAWV